MAKNNLVRKMQAQKIVANAFAEQQTQKEVEFAIQRFMCLVAVTLNEEFGIGTKRFHEQFLPKFNEVRERYENWKETDQDYADGKLEQLMQEIFSADLRVGNYEKFRK